MSHVPYNLAKTVAGATPLATADAKVPLRLTTSTDDDYVDRLVLVAKNWVENHTHRTAVKSTYRLNFDRFPAEIFIPQVPVVSVDSVKYFDNDGDQQTLSSDNYQVDLNGEPGRIMPGFGFTWPAARTQYNSIEVLFDAGYADAASVPDDIVEAISIMVTDMYMHRTDHIDKKFVRMDTVEALLAPLRLLEFA